MPPIDIKAILETAADGTLAIIIISMVLGFVARRDNKLANALEGLSKVLTELDKSHAVHNELIRGISSGITSLPCNRKVIKAVPKNDPPHCAHRQDTVNRS